MLLVAGASEVGDRLAVLVLHHLMCASSWWPI
jgi:hypothetical protein